MNLVREELPNEFIRQHGRVAITLAAKRVQELGDAGDTAGAETFKSILKHVVVLLKEPQAGGQSH